MTIGAIVALVADSLWTVIALVGVGVSIWALIDGRRDKKVRDQRGTNGLERAMVAMGLRGAHAALYLHTFFLLLGIFAFVSFSPAELTPTYILLVTATSSSPL